MKEMRYYIPTKGCLIPRASDSKRKRLPWQLHVDDLSGNFKVPSGVYIRHHSLEILKSKYLKPILRMFVYTI